MDFKIELNEELSGGKAKIYSIKERGDDKTYLEHFIEDNYDSYPDEVANIIDKLNVMGHDTGCEYNLFKHNEGRAGDGVVALKDESGRFRLYCMYFHDALLICGSGGYKDIHLHAYQEDERLNAAAEKMKNVAAKVNESLRKGDIEIESDGTIEDYTDNYDYEE